MYTKYSKWSIGGGCLSTAFWDSTDIWHNVRIFFSGIPKKKISVTKYYGSVIDHYQSL